MDLHTPLWLHEDVPGAISSTRLYQEPLLRPAVWGADDTVVRVMAVFHLPSLGLCFPPQPHRWVERGSTTDTLLLEGPR